MPDEGEDGRAVPGSAQEESAAAAAAAAAAAMPDREQEQASSTTASSATPAAAAGVQGGSGSAIVAATTTTATATAANGETKRGDERETTKTHGKSESSGRKIAMLRQTNSGKKGEEQPVFLEDIHLGPKDGSLEDIQVEQARTRVRVDRAKKGKKVEVKVDKKGDDRKLNLTFRMMLGVRVAVGRQASPFLKDGLLADDFTQVDKYVFPPAGAGGRLATPSHKLNRTFKFRDYAPKVFKKLRGIFGINEASYMISVAGDYDYLELITNSKSGSFFFYSHDHKYIIKNMKRAEAKFLRGMLPQYYEHHRNNPDSVLIRFCGMYLVKSGHRKVPFVVMKCIDGAAQMPIHTRYDLKGSTVHRTAAEGDKVLKDNNLRANKSTFCLGSQREAFLKVVRADAEFLCSVNVMDYSMFISVHDNSRPPERKLQRSYTQFLTFADEASGGPEAFKSIPLKRGGSSFVAGVDVADAALQAEPDAKSSTVAERTIRYRDDGGIESAAGDDGSPSEIYWLGVIDVLQVYTNMKHLETWYKGIGRVKSELSCVDPNLYCERFVAFMEETTR